MNHNFQAGERVRITKTAILQCRKYFGRHAQWQKKDGERVFTIENIIEDIPNDVTILEVRDKTGGEIQQIAACHMEHIPNDH